MAALAAGAFLISGLVLVTRRSGQDAQSVRSQPGAALDSLAPRDNVPQVAAASLPHVGSAGTATVRSNASLLPPLGQPKPAPAPTPTTTPPPPPTPLGAAPYTLLGANDLSLFNPSYVDFETWQGHGTRVHNAVDDLFLIWNQSNPQADDVFISALTAKWNQGSVPMVTWMLPIDDSFLVSGWYDSYMTVLVAKLRAWLAGPDGVYGNADDRRLYLRPAPEANGNWNPWSPDYRNPNKDGFNRNVSMWKAGWARVHTIFVRGMIDAPHVQWVFSVNHEDAYRAISSSDWHPEPIAEEIYPGNEYVDWVALDGYQRTSSDTPDALFDDMIGRLLRMSASAKPMAVTEFGSYGADGVAAKNAWLDSYFAWLGTQPVRMSLYWNTYDPSNGSTAIEVFATNAIGDSTYTSPSGTTYQTVSRYADNVAGNSHLVPANPSNSRLLTDQQFLGQ
jgi:hypothetical protein